MRSIPKVISGLTPDSLSAITRLYTPVFDRLVPVSRPEVAEMMKLYENCQRMMNIAFANEMADACIPHGVDPFEVADAAATKPFGYMPFTPSAGVGGHCIPVNPYYLLSNSEFPLLKAAAEKMGRRPAEIAKRVVERLPGRRGRVLVVGMGFKRGQSVLSNSPGVEVVRTLKAAKGVEVVFADPLVKEGVCEGVERLGDGEWKRQVLEGFDVIVVVVRQVGLDFGVLEELEGVKIEMWAR
jgi:nucleotide sugar dehydrogenase